MDVYRTAARPARRLHLDWLMGDATRQHLSLHVSWATILKLILAVALVWASLQIAWILLLLIIATIIAVGLDPAVQWLEARRWPRGLAAAALVLLIVGTIVGFLAFSWSSLASQASTLGTRFRTLEQQAIAAAPTWLVDLVRHSGTQPDASTLAPYLVAFGQSVLWVAAAFVLAWILVVYLLMDGRTAYQWIRGFVPERLQQRFDLTAEEARKVAFGFAVGNTTTSICAAIYFFTWLTVLGVPSALLLAVLAFFFDFIPVLGFYLSCAPAMAMAATRSSTLALAMIPIYLSYDFIENYLIGPRVYAWQLQINKLAILLAFAIGAELGGVIGAVLALPAAAIYPAIERLWLRQIFGSHVVKEHEAAAPVTRPNRR